MLNEILEYEQYQISYYDDKPLIKRHGENVKDFRITFRNMGDHFTGIPRALEIIARYEIFKGKRPLNISKSHSKIEKHLDKWLEELSHSDQLQYLCKYRKKDKNGDDILTRLETYRGHFKENSIARQFENYNRNLKHNNFNASFGDRTIANAFNRGKLKNYILIQKGNPFDNVFMKESRNKKAYNLNKGEKRFDHRDYILKFTAYYLIEREQHPGQKIIALNKLLLHNWSKYVEKVRYYYLDPSGNEIDLFEEIPVYESLNKYKPYDDWINKFSIYDISKPGDIEKWILNPAHKDMTYYIDKGAHVNLECHVVAEELTH